MAEKDYNDPSIIDEIHTTEDKIEKMLKEAGDEADKIIREAKGKADEILKKGLASLKDIGGEHQRKMLKGVEEEAKRIIADADKIVEELKSSSEKKINNAVDLVIKKVLP